MRSFYTLWQILRAYNLLGNCNNGSCRAEYSQTIRLLLNNVLSDRGRTLILRKCLPQKHRGCFAEPRSHLTYIFNHQNNVGYTQAVSKYFSNILTDSFYFILRCRQLIGNTISRRPKIQGLRSSCNFAIHMSWSPI